MKITKTQIITFSTFLSLMFSLLPVKTLALTSNDSSVVPVEDLNSIATINESGIGFITNENYNNLPGATLGFSTNSNVKILSIKNQNNTYYFKDLNKNGKLDPYEDWRLDYETRIKDLASKMTPSQIAGLMLYSSHQTISQTSITKSSDDGIVGQEDFLKKGLRHVLVTQFTPSEESKLSPAQLAAIWNNNVQSLCESLDLGIPANNSSDPRHSAESKTNVEYTVGPSTLSLWPSSLGIAATFDSEIMKKFGQIASSEYRAMGISTALSPQIDIATDPRWGRFNGTFGEDPFLSSDMARAYVDGFQTTYNYDKNYEFKEALGWGKDSVNAMIKHWPGGGAGEGGRDAHFESGKYAVYPGNNFNAHLIPFVDGSLSLKDGTNQASAVMPYYTISFGQTPGSYDPIYNKGGDPTLNLGNAYSDYMITDLLRGKYNFDGVVCTDWGVVGNYGLDSNASFNVGALFRGVGALWGIDDWYESDSVNTFDGVATRAYRLIMAGVDQFGGLDKSEYIVRAYEIGIEKQGEEFMKNRFEKSAERLLRNIFLPGLFENPYLDPNESNKLVGNADYMNAGYDAQLKSIVMLKNDEMSNNSGSILPNKGKTVYVPGISSENDTETIKVLKNYFSNIVLDENLFDKDGNHLKNVLDSIDFAICFITNPKPYYYAGFWPSDGYIPDLDPDGKEITDIDGKLLPKENHGYVPISLQYSDYTAKGKDEGGFTRDISIAGRPIKDANGNITYENRSYAQKTTKASNKSQMDLVIKTKELSSLKSNPFPVVLSVTATNPMVFGEVEPYADAILMNFGVQTQAVLDIITNKNGARPTALLPAQMPKNMDEVERQFEDVPRDMTPYTDSHGKYTYDFGFGLSYVENNGKWETVVIDDSINKNYSKYANATALTIPVNKGK